MNGAYLAGFTQPIMAVGQKMSASDPNAWWAARPHTQTGSSPFHGASTLSNSLECWTTLPSRSASSIPILTEL
jgi:hypothetical protein